MALVMAGQAGNGPGRRGGRVVHEGLLVAPQQVDAHRVHLLPAVQVPHGRGLVLPAAPAAAAVVEVVEVRGVAVVRGGGGGGGVGGGEGGDDEEGGADGGRLPALPLRRGIGVGSQTWM